MLFNSLDFLLFFPLVFGIFCALPSQKSRQYWLLFASLFFYGYWKLEYLFLLLLTSSIDYGAAIFIGNQSDNRLKKLGLLLSILSNLGVLGFFKYGKFISHNLFDFQLIRQEPEWLALVLPVGISFYTFQAMAYVIDVYRNRLPAERNFGTFLLFITFFPQLVAGPIERAPHLLGQLKALQPIRYQNLMPALGLMALGFWKKLFLADRLAVFVDQVFNNPEEANGLQVLFGCLFFGFQIYCDFSGYSDIARGAARFFGVELMWNFRMPYFSSSLSQFWRHWHISLSGWFRDYVYHPLGGNQMGQIRLMLNLLLVFSLSGIWHGANWTFLFWGLWHGMGLVLERIFKLEKANSVFYKMLVLTWVFGGWMVFRTNSMSDLVIFSQSILEWNPITFQEFNLFHSSSELALAITGIFLLLLWEGKNEFFLRHFRGLKTENQMVLLSFGLILLFWFGKFKGSDFIYFQF